MNMKTCKVCLEKSYLMPEVDSYKSWNLYHCGKCDVQFFEPFKEPETKYYDSQPTPPKKSLFDRIIESIKPIPWNFKEFFDGFPFRSSLETRGRILDIGCGNGQFLKLCDDVAFSPYGLEIVKYETESLEKNGIPCFNGYLNDFVVYNCGEKKFDTVSCFEVFEHITDHLTFLDNIKNVLVPSGNLVMSVPNRNRTILFSDDDVPEGHLTRWSVKSLENILDKAGFRVIYSKVRPFSIYTLAGNIWHAQFLRFIRREFGTLGKIISLILQVTLATILWLPMRLAGAQGRNIYIEAVKKDA